MKFLKILLLSLMMGFSSTWAASLAYTAKSNLRVKAEPSSRAATVVTLQKRGQKVVVGGFTNNWYRVKVVIPGGFEVSGWLPAGSLTKKRAVTRRRTQRRPAPRRATRRPTRSRTRPSPARSRTSTDDFFEPANSRRPARSSSRRRNSRRRSNSMFGGKLRTQIGGSVIYFTHKVTSDTGNDFNYSITGPSVFLDASYQVWESRRRDLVARLGARYGYGLMFVKTNLQDNAGVVFDTQTKKNKLTNLDIYAQVEKLFVLPSRKRLWAGLNLGYQIFDFVADDITDVQGIPLALFVSHKTKGIVVGPYVRYPLSSFTLNAGVDVLLKPKHEEDPAGSSGVDPVPAMGFIPKV